MKCYSNEEITLSMKDKIEDIRLRAAHTASSHAFSSLYIWKDDLKLKILFGDNSFTVRSRLLGTNDWFFPCGSHSGKKDILNFLISEYNDNLSLHYLRIEDCIWLDENMPGQFSISASPGDSEYLYSRQEHEALEGKKFAKIRNHIRKTQREYNITCEPISSDNIHEVKKIINSWSHQPHKDSRWKVTDSVASLKLFDNMNELDVSGILIKIDGVSHGAVAGFPLSSDTFDMCFAKQLGNIAGIGVYSKHKFITSLDSRFKFVNAEEDLGLEGLISMKKQMVPCDMLNMYTAKIIK